MIVWLTFVFLASERPETGAVTYSFLGPIHNLGNVGGERSSNRIGKRN